MADLQVKRAQKRYFAPYPDMINTSITIYIVTTTVANFIVYFSFIDDVRLAQRLLLHSHFLLLEFLLTKIDSIHQLLNARICQSEMLSFHFCLKPFEIHDPYNGYLNYVFTPLFYCSYFSLKDELVVVHYLINEYF